MRKTLDYICMQPTTQGQASYAHVNEIVAGLRRRGWDVRLVEPPQPRPGRGDGLRRATAAFSTQLDYWLRRRFRPARFVYIRSHFVSLPTAILAWLAGSTVILEVNGPADDAYAAWPLLRMIRPLLAFIGQVQLRLADVIVVVTPELEEYIRRRTHRRDGFAVIGNGANIDLFRPKPRPADPTARPYVVFTGALASWQGIDTLLEAAAAPSWPLGVDLFIAGEGRERDRVVDAASAHAHVRWLGTIPYDETPAVVAGSLAALVPKADVGSTRYGLSPLKLYEAMACGVPVVASDLPGLRDTIRLHACGLTFPPGDAEALVRAIAELFDNPDLAREMGARGRAAAEALYSWDARARQTEAVLLATARRSSPRRSSDAG